MKCEGRAELAKNSVGVETAQLKHSTSILTLIGACCHALIKPTPPTRSNFLLEVLGLGAKTRFVPESTSRRKRRACSLHKYLVPTRRRSHSSQQAPGGRTGVCWCAGHPWKVHLPPLLQRPRPWPARDPIRGWRDVARCSRCAGRRLAGGPAGAAQAGVA